MVVAAIAAVSAGTLVLAIVRRRRSRRGTPFAIPAGLKHLASSVSDSSDTGIPLPAARRDLVSRHRLGVLLGLR